MKLLTLGMSRWALIIAALLFCHGAALSQASAQDASAWVLRPGQSLLRFQTVKNGSVIETNSFRRFDGRITPEGDAQIEIELDSVDTKVDLRDVRLRFLFFETFEFPKATITAQLDPSLYERLSEQQHLTFPMRFALSLHGVTKRRLTDVIVTLIDKSTVSVATVSPITISASDFGLQDGVAALMKTANVDILPAGLVTFNFVFSRE